VALSNVVVLTSHAMLMQKGRRVVRKDSTRLQVLIGQTSLKQALQHSVSFRHNDRQQCCIQLGLKSESDAETELVSPVYT